CDGPFIMGGPLRGESGRASRVRPIPLIPRAHVRKALRNSFLAPCEPCDSVRRGRRVGALYSPLIARELDRKSQQARRRRTGEIVRLLRIESRAGDRSEVLRESGELLLRLRRRLRRQLRRLPAQSRRRREGLRDTHTLGLDLARELELAEQVVAGN